MFVVHIAGRLGKKPESRYTPSGQKVTSFTLAVNQRKGKGKEDITIWVRVTVWGDRFDNMLSCLEKGSGLIVTGRMNAPSNYVDKEGRTQTSLEVTAEMLDFSPFGRTDGAQDKPGGYVSQANGANPSSFQALGDEESGSPYGGVRSAYAPSGAFGGGSHSSNHATDDDDIIPF